MVGLPLNFVSVGREFERNRHYLQKMKFVSMLEYTTSPSGSRQSRISLTPALLINRSKRDSCFMNVSAPSFTLLRFCRSISSIWRSSGRALDAFIWSIAFCSLSGERPAM